MMHKDIVILGSWIALSLSLAFVDARIFFWSTFLCIEAFLIYDCIPGKEATQ
jgi:hypothetical protein